MLLSTLTLPFEPPCADVFYGVPRYKLYYKVNCPDGIYRKCVIGNIGLCLYIVDHWNSCLAKSVIFLIILGYMWSYDQAVPLCIMMLSKLFTTSHTRTSVSKQYDMVLVTSQRVLMPCRFWGNWPDVTVAMCHRFSSYYFKKQPTLVDRWKIACTGSSCVKRLREDYPWLT